MSSKFYNDRNCVNVQNQIMAVTDKRQLISIALLVFIGTVGSVIHNFIVTQESVGYDNYEPHEFSKEWSITWIMFLGELLAFPTQVVYTIFVEKKKWVWSRSWRYYIFPAFPAVVDLVASTLSNYVVVWLPISIVGLFKGANIIFSGLLTWIFLKRKLYLYQWIAIILSVIGLVFVALATLLNSEASKFGSSKAVIGVVITLIVHLLSAIQFVFVERLMEVELRPMEFVGLQGFWGLFVTSFICLPIVYYIPGSSFYADPPFEYRICLDPAEVNPDTCNEWKPGPEPKLENILDTFLMLKNNKTLCALFSIYGAQLWLYNIVLTLVVKYCTAVGYSIVANIKTFTVWLVTLIITECNVSGFQETWNRYQFLKLAGFVVGCFASFMNIRLFELPFLYYPPAQGNKVEPESEGEISSNKSEP